LLSLVTFVYFYLGSGGIYPASSEWLQDHIESSLTKYLSLTSRYKMDRVIGGGQATAFDEELWLRFKYFEPEGRSFLWFGSDQCSPSSEKELKRWFLTAASHPTPLAWLTPWSDLDPADRLSLEDDTNLSCMRTEKATPTSIERAPNNDTCSYQWLYNRKTGFIYVLYHCSL